MTEFPFLYFNGWYLRNQWKINGKGTSKNQSESEKSNNFFAARRNIAAPRKKDQSCKSKRRERQAKYLENNRIPVVRN